jgi:membrane protein
VTRWFARPQRPGRVPPPIRPLAWRCALRLISINGYDRALGLAAQAFIAAVPMVIVASSFADQPAETFADRLVGRFHLSGTTADLVRQAFQVPDDTGTTVWGVCLLFLSGIGFARALQRAFRAAWDVRQDPGWRAWLSSMGAALAVAVAVAAGAAVATLVEDFTGAGQALFVIRAVLSGALWFLAIRLLLGWSLPWRPFLPGAVVAGGGTAVTWVLSRIWFSRAFSSQAESYGLIGIFIALISWLIVLALLLVISAVVGAELWHSREVVATAPGMPQPDEVRG